MIHRVATVIAFALVAAALVAAPSALAATGSLVSVGSPPDLFSRNAQYEPAVAIDPSRPDVVAAGAIDLIDNQPCTKNPGPFSRCPFPLEVGLSGVYFSFDRGKHWTQPTYVGLTQRDCGTIDYCDPHVGTIGTVPWYAEAGLSSDGDSALAFGPRPVGGRFSWLNGSRLYYANIALRLDQSPPRSPLAFGSIAVSRIDNPTATRIQNQANWLPPVLAATRESTETFEDKEQIWADNVQSSPFFGNVYVCWTNFVSDSGPIMVSTSRDGGETWTQRQVTEAAVVPPKGVRQACSVRTDSHGAVYVMYTRFAFGTPGLGQHMLVKSLDGGKTWTRPRAVQTMNDACYFVDPIQRSCTMEGPGGARADLSASPSLDIANGAPTGDDATNELVDAWSDGRFGLNHEVSLVSYSTDGGDTWSPPSVASEPGDRAFYTAPAIAPDGSTLYLTAMAYETPFQTDLANPRSLHSVFRRAAIGANGAPGAWTTLVNGAAGDARGAVLPNLDAEFLGDYVYGAATRDYGIGVTTDTRRIADCPAVDAYRTSLLAGSPLPVPYVLTDCPPAIGNTDIFAFTG